MCQCPVQREAAHLQLCQPQRHMQQELRSKVGEGVVRKAELVHI